MLCAAEGWPSWTHARLFERIDLLSADEPLPFYESLPHRRKPGVRIYA
jgi:hypothetical protein